MNLLVLQLILLFAIAVCLGNLVPVRGGGIDGLGVYLFFNLIAPLAFLAFLAAILSHKSRANKFGILTVIIYGSAALSGAVWGLALLWDEYRFSAFFDFLFDWLDPIGYDLTIIILHV